MSGFSINRIVLSGNLTADPELRALPSGTAVANLRLANNTRRKNSSTGEWEDKPNFFSVTIWGNFGEAVVKDLSKGDGVVVEGRIEWRQYEDSDGNKRQAYDVIADSVVRLGKRGGGNGPDRGDFTDQVPADRDGLGGDPGPEAPAPAAAGADDDIPF